MNPKSNKPTVDQLKLLRLLRSRVLLHPHLHPNLLPVSLVVVLMIVLMVVALLALPQLEYRKDPKAYFLITEDYEAYKEYMAEKAAQ